MAKFAPLGAKAAKQKTGPPIQTKLNVGPARDRYEVEADRIADRVVSQSKTAPRSAPPAISRLPTQVAQRAPVQKPIPKKDEVKTEKVKDEEEDKSTTVQRRAEGPVAAPASAERSINSMRTAGGKSLDKPVRQHMESGLGRSLSNVRVHNYAAANSAAKSVGARAFTVGNDVFFGSGNYQPTTPKGQHLLAHELVHTEQQKGLGNTAQTMALQRNGEDTPAEDLEEDQPVGPGLTYTKSGSPGSRIELNETGGGGKIFLPDLPVPRIQGGTKGATNHPKARGVNDPSKNPLTPGSPYVYKGKTPRGSDTARQTFLRNEWFQGAEENIEPALAPLLPSKVHRWDQGAEITGTDNVARRYLRMKGQSAGNTNQIIIGSPAEIADHENVKMPTWDRRGRTQFYDVDHAQELQLGGLDAWDNFWLLDQSSNRSSGSKIASELRKKINAILTSSQSADFWTADNQGRKPSYNDDIKAGTGAWTVEFATFSQLEISGNDRYWTRSEIQAGDHLVHLRAMTEREIVAEGLVYAGPGGTPSHISIFTSDFGGYRRRMNLTAGVATPDRRAGGTGFYKGFDLTEDMAYTAPPTGAGGEVIGVLRGTMFRKENSEGEVFDPQPTTLNVINKPQFGYGGHVDTLQLRRAILAMTPNASALSPMGFTEAGLNNQGEIYANGMITATKALFPGLEIPISILGNDIFITFPVPTDKLSFGPVSVPEASISLGVGDNGVFLSGFAAIEVASVGSGMLEARVEDGNTIISGDFNFDLDFLDPATASASYNFNTDEFTLSLTAGVQEGRIPGIESGEVTATFTRETIAISGSLVAGGMLSGTVVSVSYSLEEGLSLGADNIPLPIDRIPGVTSATASLYARQNPETREWSFGGTGSATLGIAGATGSITVGVDGDKVTFGGNLTVAKGPASGSISFTATNVPMDEDGNITEGDALEEYTVFGRGSAEITFGSVLKGSAAIELSPDASITISGTIGLPPTFEVFPKQEYNKSLLKVETPDFPIWGVSVGGVGIGIFAFADAELSFNAFVGPGQLVDTQITATMDLDAPEDAVITGSARFTVPAYAGFNLDIGGGLRARATVAFVEGRVGLDGELGIEADASAGVDVNWNRTDGLTVDAEVEANARPKFRVGVNASVTAGVDLLLTEVSHTWGPWRKTLGEFGPDMEMGVTIPVSWNENTGVDFSLDDIVIRKPEFNTKDILKSSFEELV